LGWWRFALVPRLCRGLLRARGLKLLRFLPAGLLLGRGQCAGLPAVPGPHNDALQQQFVRKRLLSLRRRVLWFPDGQRVCGVSNGRHLRKCRRHVFGSLHHLRRWILWCCDKWRWHSERDWLHSLSNGHDDARDKQHGAVRLQRMCSRLFRRERSCRVRTVSGGFINRRA
jgi:hypothetical protein